MRKKKIKDVCINKKAKKTKIKAYCPRCSKKRILRYLIFAVSPSGLKGQQRVCIICYRKTQEGRRIRIVI